MKNKNTRTTLQALYFVFCLLLLFAEPVGPACVLAHIGYFLFVVANWVALVLFLRKPSTPMSRVNQDAR